MYSHLEALPLRRLVLAAILLRLSRDQLAKQPFSHLSFVFMKTKYKTTLGSHFAKQHARSP